VDINSIYVLNLIAHPTVKVLVESVSNTEEVKIGKNVNMMDVKLTLVTNQIFVPIMVQIKKRAL
jgi:hypothetical protein